jgi:hypothetical protein
MFERGIGMNFTGVVVGIYEDYASFTKLRDKIVNIISLTISEPILP